MKWSFKHRLNSILANVVVTSERGLVPPSGTERGWEKKERKKENSRPAEKMNMHRKVEDTLKPSW